MKRNIIFVIFLILYFNTANSTVYYVSNSGNDNNIGITPLTPWKTIAKVNSAMSNINPGDKILFNKGSTFYGTINVTKSGTAGNDIVFGSYGSGNLPVITGKKLITGWTPYSGNIYRASVNLSDTISHIYINQKLMTIARYPNTGFLKVDANTGNTGIYDASLNQAPGYWNGANCRLRTINWAYETKVVSNFSNGNLTFSSATQYTTLADFGYFLDNKLILLDAPNEWFYDKTTGYVYLYAPGGVNPSTLNVEAVIARNAFLVTISRQYLKFENLNLSGFSDMGVNAYTDNNLTVTGCTISQTTSNAIGINGSNIIITNNYFEDNLNNAIYAIITNGQIKNNNINRTGLYPGYGANGRGYLGINVHISTGLTVENNIIDSTGYSAISTGKNMIIKNNYINNSLLVMNDGAGIDISTSDSLQILNNIILNTIGNTESSANPELYGSGIYVNGAVIKNSLIQNNTSSYNTYAGIYFDHKNTPVNNKIIGNTLYNNFKMQILFADLSAISNVPVYNTITKKNIFYSLQAEQYGMVQRSYTGTYNDYGTFDSNYYCNPYSDYTITRVKFTAPFTSTSFSLANWKTNFGKDLNSKTGLVTFQQYGITDTLSGNLISNSKFNSSISQWTTWPQGSSIAWTNNPLLDSGCMRIRWDGNGYSQSFTIGNNYSITKGSYYLISLSSASTHPGTFNIWGLSSFSSSTFTFPQTFFSYSNSRKEHSFTFRADTTDPAAFFSVGMLLPDSLLYIDNVNAYRVAVNKLDSTQLSKLFINETNNPKIFSLGSIIYHDLDGNPVSGSINIQPYSSKILTNGGFTPQRNLQLKVLPEGMYNLSSDKMIPDSITVFIRKAVAPFSIVDSAKSLLDSNGNGSFNFQKALNTTDYYIVVNNRNLVETWSSIFVNFNADYLSYDFTTSASKAFGNNLKLRGSRYCVFSGDVNNDGHIELSDILQISNAAGSFSTGFIKEDLNGDKSVDLSDVNIVTNNSLGFVKIKRP